MKFSNPDDIGYYVYALTDPSNNEVFYIGKGVGNRVFQHAEDALSDEPTVSDKLDRIRSIHQAGHEVVPYLIRHQLTEQESLLLEATCIDLMSLIGKPLTNIQGGHHSGLFGLMSVNEVERKYSLESVDSLPSGYICININRSYQRGAGFNDIYQATKEAWVINKNRLQDITHVLAEYRGRVVAVFTNLRWYEVHINGRLRYGFDGDVAEQVKDQYLNKLVPPRKKGAIAPVRFNF